MTQKIPTPKSLHSDPQQTCVCRRSDTCYSEYFKNIYEAWMKSNALYKTSPARTVHWQRMPGGTHQAQKPELWHLATYFWTWAEGCQDHQFVHDSLQNSSSPCLKAAFDRDSSNQACKFQQDSTGPSFYCYDKTTSRVSNRRDTRLPWECCDTSPNSWVN